MSSIHRYLALLVIVPALMATLHLAAAGAGQIHRLLEEGEIEKALQAEDHSDRTEQDKATSRRDGGEKETDPLQKIAKLVLYVRAFHDIDSATQLGDVDRVRVLLKQDPKKALDKNLMWTAASYGRDAIVKLLLEYKADPEDSGYGGLPVLYFALEHPKVVRVLLERGANPNVCVTYRGFGMGPWNSTLLLQAAEKGQVETAKLLLEAGVSVNEGIVGENTPLLAAASHGQPKMVTFLLKNNARVSGDIGRYAMELAGNNIRPEGDQKDLENNSRNKAVIDILHAQRIPFDLFTAVALNKVEVVQELLKRNPALARSKDRHDEHGQFPLSRAVEMDHLEIVKLLLDSGAPINDKNAYGYTALHSAALWGREKIAKLLIERKADVNATADNGFTPLHESARLNTPAVARLLLAAGAKVNAKDAKGRTPLSWTASPGLPGDWTLMVDLLRKHGGTR